MARWIVTASLMAGIGFAPHAQANDAIWRTPWTTEAPAPVRTATFSADGEVVLAALDSDDLHFTRLNAAGGLRWSANLHVGTSVLGSVAASADGTAFSTASGTLVSRFGTDGSVLWQQPLAAAAIVQVSPQRVAALGYQSTTPVGQTLLSMLDTATGAILWQSLDPPFGSGDLSNALTTDVQGNMYYLLPGVSSYQLVKRDGNGALLWRLTYPGTGAITLQLAGDNLYVGSPNTVSAYRRDSGVALWANAANRSTLRFVAAEPVVGIADAIERLAADTGVVRWSVSIAGSGSGLFDVIDDTVIAVSPSGGTTATRIDGATGAVLGTTALPAFASSATTTAVILGIGKLGTAMAGVVGVSCSEPVCISTLARFALGDGALVAGGATANTPHGLVSSSVVDGSGGSIDYGSLGDDVHLRRVAADGSVSWDITDRGNWQGPLLNVQAIAVSSSSVAISLTSQNSVWVAAYARSDGHRLWQDEYPIFSTRANTTTQNLRADDAGNFVLAAAGLLPCCSLHNGQSVLKLAASDGALLWRRDTDVSVNASTSFAPFIHLVGGDVFVFGPFETVPARATLVKLAGADGTTLWSNSSYTATGAVVTSDGNLANFDATGFIKINATDGSLIWTESADVGCGDGCFLENFQQLPDGDFIQGGYAEDPSSNDPGEPWLAIQRGDGRGAGYHGDPMLPDQPLGDITQVFAGNGGSIWLRFNQYSRGYRGMTWLCEFDPLTHALKSRQLVTIRRPGDIATTLGSFSIVANPAVDRLLVNTIEFAPDTPARSVDQLLDTTITAHGDLAVAIASSIVPDHGLSHVTVTTRYTGDVAIDAVIVRTVVPAPISGVPTCNASTGSTCSSSAVSGGIHAALTLQPGATATIAFDLDAGQVDPNAVLEAFIYGPIGLSETSMGNNIAYGSLLQPERCAPQRIIHAGNGAIPGRPGCLAQP